MYLLTLNVVQQIRVKIALDRVKAWNFVQIKLLSCKSRIDLGYFKNSDLFCMPIWLLQTKYSIEGENSRK